MGEQDVSAGVRDHRGRDDLRAVGGLLMDIEVLELMTLAEIDEEIDRQISRLEILTALREARAAQDTRRVKALIEKARVERRARKAIEEKAKTDD